MAANFGGAVYNGLVHSFPNVRAYLDHLRDTCAPTTWGTYERGLRKCQEFLDDTGLALEGDPQVLIDEYVRWLDDQRYAIGSIRSYTSAPVDYCEWARGRGLRLPALAKPTLPSVQLRLPRTVPPELVREFLLATARKAHEPARTALLLVPASGLRLAELAALELQHVRSPVGRMAAVVLGVEGPRGWREVPLMIHGPRVLRSYLLGDRARRHPSSPYVFAARAEAVQVRTLYNWFRRIHQQIGAPSAFTPDVLRRAYSSMLLDAGCGQIDVCHLLGSRVSGHRPIEQVLERLAGSPELFGTKVTP